LEEAFDETQNASFGLSNSVTNPAATQTVEASPRFTGRQTLRNNFRGDGYFDIDSGLSKAWTFARYGALKFSWEVYNVSNSVRFDPFSINTQLTSGTLGVASSELTSPRRMQFALRYDF
jgi:hypothetical protein